MAIKLLSIAFTSLAMMPFFMSTMNYSQLFIPLLSFLYCVLNFKKYFTSLLFFLTLSLILLSISLSVSFLYQWRCFLFLSCLHIFLINRFAFLPLFLLPFYITFLSRYSSYCSFLYSLFYRHKRLYLQRKIWPQYLCSRYYGLPSSSNINILQLEYKLSITNLSTFYFIIGILR